MSNLSKISKLSKLSKLSKRVSTTATAGSGAGQARGQVVIEAILLLAAILLIVMAAAKAFENQEILRNLVQSPWKNLAGMMENGQWAPPTAATRAKHPNAMTRHAASLGEEF